jgi:DNA-binding beta-propeller fold protein YncE
MAVRTIVFAVVLLTVVGSANAGQAPAAAAAPDQPVSSRDRVYLGEQFSNTLSVVDPASNTLVGAIRLGDPQPANLSPLYRGQLLVHGLGFSPDHRTVIAVSIGSNSVTFIDTATNAIKHITYVGRSPHEAFFTPDGREVWVSVRGEDYVAVLDAKRYAEIARIPVPNGPGMVIFSPDGRYGYVCSSFTPQTVVIDVRSRRVAGRVQQPSPFCPNIAASPRGDQVWFTLKDVGKVVVFNARPPFNVLREIETGAITNHVNFALTRQGQLAYVTIGGLNEVQAFRTDTFERIATIPTGPLPHGIWPSGDGTRMYVGIENGDAVSAIDTELQQVVATIPTGQAAQAVVYVPNAVPQGDGRANLAPLGVGAMATQLRLAAPGASDDATTVALFDQGLTQILQAGVTGLAPKAPYVLALADNPQGDPPLQELAAFSTNPAGAAVVDAVGPIRQVVAPDAPSLRRYLVIAPVKDGKPGAPVQLQRPWRP